MHEWMSVLSLILGLFISMGTLLTVTLPGLRKRFFQKLERILGKEFLETEIKQMKDLLEKHIADDKEKKQELKLQKEVDLCILRDLITNIYYKHMKDKTISVYELENAVALHDLYRKRGGNSYIPHLFRQMTEEWTVVQS